MKVVAGLILAFLLGTMFVSLFTMSMDMDMTGGMSDCPFMSHDEVLCPMNLIDHIGAWKSAFLAVVPTIVFLLIGAGAVALTVSLAPHLISPRYKPIPILPRMLRERTYSFFYRLFQELFSNGILNPKLF
ncbi:hypothetical protein KC727_03355 [Candidatus Kaiserbacteria bacterium]|nr:hypothetical protein [Candidatus Kaiserbacteria bacterium]